MTTTQPDSSGSRILFLDNVRYLMIVFVILLHAAASYGNMLSWWYVRDAVTNTKFFDATVLIIDVFVIPVLFFIAGYFALPDIRKKGTSIFLKDKLKRLGIPWLLGVIIISPIIVYIGSYKLSPLSYGRFWINWMKSAGNFPIGYMTDTFAFNHTVYWFISLLLFFFIIFGIIYALKKRFFPSTTTQTKVHSGKTMLLVMLFVWFASLILSMPAVVLPSPYPDPWGNIANILQFRTWRLATHIIFFALGIYAFSKNWFVKNNNFPGHPLLWLSICAISCFGYLGIMSNLMLNPADKGLGLIYLLLRHFLQAIFLIVFTGIAFRYWNRPHKINETIAANSYNIYLVHIPLVIVLQLLLLNLAGAPSLIKFGIVASFSFLISYAISQYFIKPRPRFAVAAIFVIFLLMVFFITGKTTTKAEYAGAKVKYAAKNVAFFIARSTAINRYFPDGFLNYLIPIYDEKGERLKDPGMIKEVQLLDPAGAVFKTLRNGEYIQSATLELSGYSETNDGYIWMGFDTAFNSNALPAMGNYQVVVTSISGDKTSTIFSFNPKKKDPITGFPSAIKYDGKTRTVTWNPTSGQTGYTVLIYKGDFNPGPNLRNRVYMHRTSKDNLISEPKFTIPDTVALSSSEKYYILVQAYCSDGNEDKSPNYMHMQTNLSETVIFSGDGK